MALRDYFKGLLNKKREHTYAKMLSGKTPIFSQFGDNIYASDIVKVCVDRIAGQIGKLQPKHVFEGAKGLKKIPKSTLNRLFRYSPNPIMITRDFLEKIIWLLFTNYNCFIYPTFDIINGAKVYTGLYPLDPTSVTFLEDKANKIYVEMRFKSGDTITIPYSNVIHLRKGFSVDSIMGGGAGGVPDNTALLSVLETNDTLVSSLGGAIKSSLQLTGIIHLPTILNDDNTKKEIARFEKLLASGGTGVLPMGVGATYTPVKTDPKMIDRETIAFMQEKILGWYAVPYKIYTGDFTDDDYQAWYEICLNPIVVGLNQAFTKALFTDREIDVGNYVEFFPHDLNLLSMKSKLELIKTAGEMGILSDNQKLEILGLPPIENGERITMSLNYIDKNIINQYQLKGKENTKNE